MSGLIKVAIYILLLFGGSSIACIRNIQEKKEIREYLDKTIRLDLFTSINSPEKFKSYKEFRDKYKYVSVVFLRKGCRPCDLKIVDWQKNEEKIRDIHNYTVLFIVQGYTIDEIKRMKSNNFFDFNFVIDIHYRYLIYNKDIPYWILNNSVLIDANNKIKLVGDPFTTPTKLKQFQSIVKNQ